MRNCFLAALMMASGISFSQSPPDLTDPTWQLAWSDEFNDGVINTSLWHVADEFDHWGAHNIVYLDDNVTETGGNLVLTFKQQNYSCTAPHGQPGDTYYCVRQANSGGSLIYNYTGGYLWSNAAYNFEYGYIEARVKINYGRALWPAFWTLVGDGVSSSSANEIDIFEFLMWPYQDHSDMVSPWDTITTNLHYTYPPPGSNQDPADGFHSTYIASYDGIYRTYAVEWNPDEITWFVDGISIRVPYENHDIQDLVKVVFDLGIRDDQVNGSTPAQKDMLIDYVRVYQKNGDCGSSPTYCVFNYNGWTEAVKQDITLGCSGYSNTQPSGTTQYFWVTNSFTVAGELTVPSGSSMVVQIEESCY